MCGVLPSKLGLIENPLTLINTALYRGAVARLTLKPFKRLTATAVCRVTDYDRGVNYNKSIIK